MTSWARTLRDNVYIFFFSVQVTVMLLVDLPPFLYPASWWEPPSSPLHFIASVREFYIETYHDPLFSAPHDQQPSWFRLFIYLELYYQLPAIAWALYRLLGQKHTTAGTELWCLVYGIECALTTLVCIYDVGFWDPKVYDQKAKNVFIYQLFGPWFVLPTIMAIDMYMRLLGRAKGEQSAIESSKKQQ